MKPFLSYCLTIAGTADITLSLDFSSHNLWVPLLGIIALSCGSAMIGNGSKIMQSA